MKTTCINKVLLDRNSSEISRNCLKWHQLSYCLFSFRIGFIIFFHCIFHFINQFFRRLSLFFISHLNLSSSLSLLHSRDSRVDRGCLWLVFSYHALTLLISCLLTSLLGRYTLWRVSHSSLKLWSGCQFSLHSANLLLQLLLRHILDISVILIILQQLVVRVIDLLL